MPQAVAAGAESDQIRGVVGAALQTRDDVVDVQKPVVIAPFAETLMAVAGQDFSANPGRDRALVAFTGLVDKGVTPAISLL